MVLSGKRTQAEAARLLCRSERQVRRVQRWLEGRGPMLMLVGLIDDATDRIVCRSV